VTSAPPPPKDLRDGRYVLVAPLGQGAQGTTWDAVDKREGRAVAIKAFDVRGARAWKDVELAEREARVLSELLHPLLPRYVEHFETDGVLYLVMEKVLGTPVSQLQKQGRGMSEADVTRFLQDADVALTYLHGRSPPVIHRDLKPSNVIRRPDGSFAFVDFGAVKDHLRSEGGSTVVGTFGYMAPEQFQGRAGPATDIYAVGATAMAMLTGLEPEKLPHRGLSVDVDAALRGRPAGRLREVLARMLEPDPDKRPTRIGPLLASIQRGPASQRGGRGRADSRRAQANMAARFDRSDWDFGDSRHARHVARRAARQAGKLARRQGRGTFRLPFFVRVPIVLALTLARIAVALAMGVIVPLMLTLLSLLFGRSLRLAARQVRVAAGHVGEALTEARGRVSRGWGAPDEERVRVGLAGEVSEEPRVRVATSGARVRVGTEEEEGEGVEQEDEKEEKRRGRRGL
jgi:hypothetical protein